MSLHHFIASFEGTKGKRADISRGFNRFTLGSSPAREAYDLVESLESDDLDTLKLATFSLKILLKEEEFTSEFLRLAGFQRLIEVVNITEGNTLAYALLALQTLLVLEMGDAAAGELDHLFYARIVEIIGTRKFSSGDFFSLVVFS